jgi:hypothetical protein
MTRLLWHTYRTERRSGLGYAPDWYESVLVAVTTHWLPVPVAISHPTEPIERTGRYTSGFG